MEQQKISVKGMDIHARNNNKHGRWWLMWPRSQQSCCMFRLHFYFDDSPTWHPGIPVSFFSNRLHFSCLAFSFSPVIITHIRYCHCIHRFLKGSLMIPYHVTLAISVDLGLIKSYNKWMQPYNKPELLENLCKTNVFRAPRNAWNLIITPKTL